MAKLLELRPPVTVDDPRTCGRSWPVHSWAHYIQSRPPLVDTIDWGGPSPLFCAGMHTHAPLGVGSNCPVGSSTTANAATHSPICG